MNTRRGEAFKVERPGFRVGAAYHKKHADELRPNFRNGLGNKDITRRNFDSSKIAPRLVPDFDKLQAMDLDSQGSKVELSDKTITELFSVAVPDATDLTWIAERDRLVARFTAAGLTGAQIARELEVNKPLGREQRTIKTNRNIGAVGLDMGQKLTELGQEIKDGRAENKAQQAQMIAQFALILNDTNAIARLTQAELAGFRAAMARVGVPTNHKRLGLAHRYVDYDYYLNNSGMINLLLFSKVSEAPESKEYDYDRMVKDFVNNPQDGLPAVSLSMMLIRLRFKGQRMQFLDLDLGGLIDVQQLKLAIRNTLAGPASFTFSEGIRKRFKNVV